MESGRFPFVLSSLHEATAVFLCIRPLPPRSWWRLRALSADWRRLLDGTIRRREVGSRIDNEFVPGLMTLLVNGFGPLRSANQEIDFAGLIYTAVHHGAVHALQLLLRPLMDPSWARPTFAGGVAREALMQAAVSGDIATCQAVLRTDRLSTADVEKALQAAEDWDTWCPGCVEAHQRAAVNHMLMAAAC